MAIDPNLITTERVGELPPLPPTLESKVPHEIGTTLNYFTIQQLVAFIAPLVSALQYQVIELDVPQQFITDNFDLAAGPSMGLGTNLMLGYAICNGNNGTVNRDKRSSIAYGVSNAFVGTFKGSEDSVVVAHSHLNGVADDNDNNAFVYGSSNAGIPGLANSSIQLEGGVDPTRQGLTSSTGEPGAGKNYHPVVVTLTVMKL